VSLDWSAFLQASAKCPIHPLWEFIDPELREGQIALELGCGAGAGVEHLVGQGLKVIAVDQEPEALAMTRERVNDHPDVHLVRAQFQDLGLDAESLDVIIAGFSIFFLRSWEFGQVWQRLLKALRPGGIFAGQLLGVNDDWRDEGVTTHTLAEVQSLLHPFDVIHLEEVERDGRTITGQNKHWHIFHLVARKREVAE
jgi:SAM-dependent methyltransferase